MTTKALRAAGGTALLLLSVACGGGENAESAGRDAAAPDTARLRAVYGEIDSTYDSLMTRYGPTAFQLSPQERQLYESMQQMHARTKSMHGVMMGGGGVTGGRRMMGGRMMQREAAGPPGGSGAVREWDQQMMSMHQAMSGMFQEAGAHGLAALHRRMADLYGQALESTPPAGGPAPPPEASAPEREDMAAASDLFAQNCAPCHGSDGGGVAGVFPPLAYSELIAGDADTAIRVVLHGLQGPIQVQGRTYDGVMPSFGARLTDREVAALLSYARAAFGNGASAVDAASVDAVRREDAGRSSAMTPDELR